MVDVTRELAKPSYDGMLDAVAGLWRDFLKLYGDKFETVEYNVRVGQGLDPGPSQSEEMRRMWYMVTTKRVDVVANRQNQTWVIEVEERPGLRTFGQLRAYELMLPKYYPVRDVVVAALVCRYIGFDMFGLFRAQNHYIFQFQPGRKPNLPPQFLPSTQMAGYTEQTA